MNDQIKLVQELAIDVWASAIMDEWVEEYIHMSEWASEKMNEVMIRWLNEERLAERSTITSYRIQIDKGICLAIWMY